MTRDDGGPPAASRWRLFVALPVPAASASAIHAALAAHRHAHPEARWLDPTLYHVTLRFLGSLDRHLVPELAAVTARCASEVRPFRISVDGGGGSRGRSEVAWLDLLAGRAQVVDAADRLDRLLPPEVRTILPASRPAPHVTVARRASARLVEALASDRSAAPRVAWMADRMALLRSHTGTPARSTYEALAEARLGERGSA